MSTLAAVLTRVRLRYGGDGNAMHPGGFACLHLLYHAEQFIAKVALSVAPSESLFGHL